MDSQLQEIKKRCRILRINQTRCESILWNCLRNRRFYNLKFYRQYPIKFIFDKKINYFIADFYCHERKLIIEVDGKVHEFQKDYDNMRENVLKEMGIKIIRFTNEEIEENINKVLLLLKNII
ncbi:MAG: endonuclease domain-containing protein [Patescibacteria group bacterium]|nr:endonuclease domain-containing protein [Patescibacteria group bacterium]